MKKKRIKILMLPMLLLILLMENKKFEINFSNTQEILDEKKFYFRQ